MIHSTCSQSPPGFKMPELRWASWQNGEISFPHLCPFAAAPQRFAQSWMKTFGNTVVASDAAIWPRKHTHTQREKDREVCVNKQQWSLSIFLGNKYFPQISRVYRGTALPKTWITFFCFFTFLSFQLRGLQYLIFQLWTLLSTYISKFCYISTSTSYKTWNTS